MWFLSSLFVAILIYRLLTPYRGVRVTAISAALVASLVAGPGWPHPAQRRHRPRRARLHRRRAVAAFTADRYRQRAQRDVAFAALVIATYLTLAVLLPGDFRPLGMKQGNFPPLATVIALVVPAAMLVVATSIRLPDRSERWRGS